MKRFYLLMILTIAIFVISINADIIVYERGSSSVRSSVEFALMCSAWPSVDYAAYSNISHFCL